MKKMKNLNNMNQNQSKKISELQNLINNLKNKNKDLEIDKLNKINQNLINKNNKLKEEKKELEGFYTQQINDLTNQYLDQIKLIKLDIKEKDNLIKFIEKNNYDFKNKINDETQEYTLKIE